MTNPAIIRARKIFVERHKPSQVREIAALNGAYDQGTDITQYLAEAEEWLMRHPVEVTEGDE
jgi:uncharacterized protein with von Willebrand factor type A (vWA) domain